MFYILLHDYFISHQLLTRHCSLHLFWRGKQIMWVKVKFSVFRIICGFNFIPWERVIYSRDTHFTNWRRAIDQCYMGVFSWKGRATPEKNWKIYNRLADELLSDDKAFRRQHLCPFHFHLFCSIPSSIYGHLL
jgi:hypothetical protein